jgi:hypothetical protein
VIITNTTFEEIIEHIILSELTGMDVKTEYLQLYMKINEYFITGECCIDVSGGLCLDRKLLEYFYIFHDVSYTKTKEYFIGYCEYILNVKNIKIIWKD